MKRLLGRLLLLATIAVVAPGCSNAFGAVPAGILQLELLLNGSPKGWSQTTATNPATGSIALTAGDVVVIRCGGAVFLRLDGTAATTNGEPVEQNERYGPFVVAIGVTAANFLPVAGAVTCNKATLFL